jgi:DNA-binding NtrC family response regulator
MMAKPTDETQVLVIEDEPRLRDVLVSGVREIGFPARGARSGEEALRLLEQEAYDILLVDLNLPGIHGLELVEQVRLRRSGTSFIILTGYGDLEAARQAIRLDVTDFLTKPTSLGELEKALHRAWSRLPGVPEPKSAPPSTPRTQTASPQTLEEIERDQILAALERHNGNRAAVAAELGISVRTLYYKLAAIDRDSDL